MNTAYANLVRARVAGALAEAAALRAIDHDGLMGELRETVIRQLLLPLLPTQVGVTSGVIISHQNHQSTQTDLIIYDKTLLPPLLVSESGLVPIEAALYTIEVKSKLDSAGLRQAHDAAVALGGLPILAGIHGADGKPIEHTVTYPIPTVFAFDTDLKPGHTTDLHRYEQMLAGAVPALRTICVAGRESWHYEEISPGTGRWTQWPKKQPHDEIVGFLGGLLNSLRTVANSRGSPRLGNYFV